MYKIYTEGNYNSNKRNKERLNIVHSWNQMIKQCEEITFFSTMSTDSTLSYSTYQQIIS